VLRSNQRSRRFWVEVIILRLDCEISILLDSRRAVHSKFKVDKSGFLSFLTKHTHTHTITQPNVPFCLWLNLLSLVVNRRKSFRWDTTLRCPVSGFLSTPRARKISTPSFLGHPKKQSHGLTDGVKHLFPLNQLPLPLRPIGTSKCQFFWALSLISFLVFGEGLTVGVVVLVF
jgi:hypothetical protein